MRCEVKLFLCYPLAAITPVLAAVVGACLSMFGPLPFLACALIVLAYYAFLAASLLDCRKFGGWPGFFYGLALASLGTNVASFILPFVTSVPALQNSGLLFFGLTILGVYLSCSLAGFSIAWGSRRKIQAVMQILWPALFILGIWLIPTVVIIPVLAFGLQGLQAMLLALGRDCPGEYPPPQGPHTPEIGWET